uniref:Integrase catalytic domain-containing protein n=1 Tax=Amphimedon queenslandica TaxID=400682 RepID=A0A1X7TQD7_AMPQE
LEGKHYGVPVPPPLPAFRVREAPPFLSTGVDFAGPLFIKEHRECESKVWVCLFPCCATRAIHLDIVNNMSVQSFIRFAARRGLPDRMISDNAKTFKGAARIIGKIMKYTDVHQYLENFRVKWVFNVERPL